MYKSFALEYWKPRTKPNCFEGVGAIGLNWLKKSKRRIRNENRN